MTETNNCTERGIGRSKIRYKTIRGIRAQRGDERAGADAVGLERPIWSGPGLVDYGLNHSGGNGRNASWQTPLKIPHRLWDGYGNSVQLPIFVSRVNLLREKEMRRKTEAKGKVKND